MTLFPASSTLTGAACGVASAATSCATPGTSWSVVLFVTCGLALGFVWPRSPWRLPLTLALSAAIVTSVVRVFTLVLEHARPSGMDLVLSLPSPVLAHGVGFLITCLSLLTLAVASSAAGAWLNSALVAAITPDIRQRVDTRAATAICGDPAGPPPEAGDPLCANAPTRATPDARSEEPARSVASH